MNYLVCLEVMSSTMGTKEEQNLRNEESVYRWLVAALNKGVMVAAFPR